MKVKLVNKECSWCKIEYLGRSYQVFCGVSCSDKSYYWHRKRGLKRKVAEIKCDICGNFFVPRRNNSKRCSDVCRSRWTRNFSFERYRKRKITVLKNASIISCAVCFNLFKVTTNRKTCSKKCSKIYGSYSAKKRRIKLLGFYEEAIIAMPSHKPISVGRVNVNSRKDLESAVTMFLNGGGKIRRYDAMIVTDLLEDHPLKFNEVVTEEVLDEISGTIRLK